MPSLPLLLWILVLAGILISGIYALASNRNIERIRETSNFVDCPDINHCVQLSLLFVQTDVISPEDYWLIMGMATHDDLEHLEKEGAIRIKDGYVFFIERNKALRNYLSNLRIKRKNEDERAIKALQQ